MKQAYKTVNFRAATLKLIEVINDLVEDYQQQGFMLTTRQVYYQLVARDIIPNTLQEYKRVAGIINDAKEAGLIDWDAIEDRTREFSRQQRWDNGAQILRAAVSSYHQDMWVGQEYRVFAIVEKEALVGVLEPTCRKYDVPLLAARGYPSGTVLREFVQSDVIGCLDEGKVPIFLHLGDHDPSGIDMTRDLMERIRMFSGQPDLEINRIALTMDQVRAERPPRNPAKSEDSRFAEYKRLFGTSSWELDALSPRYLANLLSGHIESFIQWDEWQAVEAEVKDTKERITELSKDFE